MLPQKNNEPLDSRFRGNDDWKRIFADRLRQNADLSKTNWFRVGGVAEWLFKPESSGDLAEFFRLLPLEIPVTVLGVGSNIIVRDGGIDGVVIKLGRGFTDIVIPSEAEGSLQAKQDPSTTLCYAQDDKKIMVGAGCLDVNIAQFALNHSISGLEFLSGIPGTLGGAVKMNAGAYGSDISQVLLEAEIVERDGTIRVLSNEQIGFSYRNSGLPEGAIVTRAVLKASPGNKDEIARKMTEISAAREETQPVRTRTGGSTFKNPPGYKAWELIDKAGCRGLRQGGAQVSELHCNFLINTGNATARDLEDLGEAVRRRVRDMTGITLEWEIKRIGKNK